MKKISIITINYNNLAGLRDTLESVREQSWKDFEHIVIDGGSTDGSKELIERNRARFSYWVSERDKGIYHAINKGIDKALGEYVLVLNSGDILASNSTLEDVFSYLTGEDIIYGDSFLINDKKNRKEIIAPKVLSLHFFQQTNLVHQSVFIKKSLHERMGLYDEGYKIISDWKFYIDSIIKGNATFRRAPLHICRYDRSGLSSTSVDLLLEEKNYLMENVYPFYFDQYEVRYPFTWRTLVKMLLPYGVVAKIKNFKKRKGS